MSMPWQLREGLRRHPKGSRPARPLVETLLSIAAHQLPIPLPSDAKRYILQNLSLRWPFLSACKLSRDSVEFYLPSLHRNELGPTQTFRIKAFRVGYGIRHSFICNDCGRGFYKLYYHNHRIACRHCHGAVWASQTLDKRTRPILQASRIESVLNKRLYQQTRERLTKKLGQKLMLAHTKLGTRAANLLD